MRWMNLHIGLRLLLGCTLCTLTACAPPAEDPNDNANQDPGNHNGQDVDNRNDNGEPVDNGNDNAGVNDNGGEQNDNANDNGEPQNTNDNGEPVVNANDNGNDNVNLNDNGGGNENLNTNTNTNTNVNDNANDNGAGNANANQNGNDNSNDNGTPDPTGPVSLIAVDVTDEGAAAMGLSVCRLFVQFDNPLHDLRSVVQSDFSTNDPDGFFQHEFGSDTAPRQVDVDLVPDVVYDSFVTIGVAIVPAGETDNTALLPDWDSVLFNDGVAGTGSWFTIPFVNPDESLQILIAQFTVSTGSTVDGTLSPSGLLASGEQYIGPMDFSCPP